MKTEEYHVFKITPGRRQPIRKGGGVFGRPGLDLKWIRLEPGIHLFEPLTSCLPQSARATFSILQYPFPRPAFDTRALCFPGGPEGHLTAGASDPQLLKYPPTYSQSQSHFEYTFVPISPLSGNVEHPMLNFCPLRDVFFNSRKWLHIYFACLLHG